MSLFSSLKESKVIEHPEDTWSYRKILEKKNEETKSEKELRKEMKEKLSEEEYNDWYRKQYYQKKKEHLAKMYRDKVNEGKAELEEIYNELYDSEMPKTIDETYIEKYREQDTDWEWRYRYSWWASRLANLYRNRIDNIWFPIRIAENYNMKSLFIQQSSSQTKAYNYISPHIDEIEERMFWISDKQRVTARPMWRTVEKMRELCDWTSIPTHQICEIAWAIKRWTHIRSEIYLWKISFLFWDVIVTSMWQMFKPSLEHNLGRLTPNTIDYIHEQRELYHKYKESEVPIAMIWDWYLIRVPRDKIYDEKWEKIDTKKFYYYIVPYSQKWTVRKERTLEEFLNHQDLHYYKKQRWES